MTNIRLGGSGSAPNETSWAATLADFESALARLEQAGLDLADADELEAAAAALDLVDPSVAVGTIPAGLVPRAQRIQQRLATLIDILEIRRASVGPELAAMAAVSTAAGALPPVPSFLDTRA